MSDNVAQNSAPVESQLQDKIPETPSGNTVEQTQQTAPQTQEQPKENVTLQNPLGIDNAEMSAEEQKEQNLFDGNAEDAENKEESTEEKTEETKEESKDPEDVIPEGDYLLQGTDGQDIALADGDNEKYQKVFKDAGLTQKQARMMVDAYKQGMEQATQMTINKANEFYKNAYTKRNQEWRDTLANDKELGGEHIEETRTNISRVMKRYATPELREYLNKTGECFNPELIKIFNKIGKDLGSDSFVGGDGVATKKESSFELAKRLYPNSPELWK